MNNKFIPITVQGLLAYIPQDVADRYFHYYKPVFDVRKKCNVRTKVNFYNVDSGGNPWVGFGAINYLKNINPIFAKKLKIEAFNSLKYWKPLDISLLQNLNLDLRDIQTETIQASLNKVVGNITANMGSGKTLSLLCIAYLCSQQGEQNAVVLPPTDKVRQGILRSAKEYGIPNVIEYNQIRGNNFKDTGYVIVASEGTLNNDFSENREPSLVDTVRTLITDEAHNWTRNSWQNLLVYFKNLNRIFGFSATSINAEDDGKPFNHLYWKSVCAINGCGPVIYRPTEDKANQYIDVPDFINLDYKWDLAKYKKLEKTKNWRTLGAKMYDNDDRNQYIISIINALIDKNRITLVPISNKAQAYKLLKLLNYPKSIMWFNDIILDNEDNKLKQDKVIGWVNNGDINVIFTGEHIKEGFDLPVLDAMVISEGKEIVNTVQKSGRIIRKSGVNPILINICDDFYIYNIQANKRSKHITDYYNNSAIPMQSIEQLQNYLNK